MNALRLNNQQLKQMRVQDYRRIEFKLKHHRYIKFTTEVIKELKNRVIGKKLSENIYNFSKENKGSYRCYNQTQLERVFDYLQRSSPEFFNHQEPETLDLSKESFFEHELDAGKIMWNVYKYIRIKHLTPDEIDHDLEMRYRAAKGTYIKVVD